MARDKAPAFQFYPRDFLTDTKVIAMSNTEVGIYTRLLCYCWLEGALPLDTGLLATMARMPLKQFTKIWEHSIVRSCFHVGADGLLHQKRLDEERAAQESHARRQSDRGVAGADARWRKQCLSNGASNAHALPPPSVSNGRPLQPAMLSDGSSSASASASAPAGGGDARSKRPVFVGQRLTVFEWMQDDALKTLGPHAEAFDLHEWFYALDALAVEKGLVIPKRDSGAWFQAQLVAEARKRGLPLQLATTERTDTDEAAWAAIAAKGPAAR